MASSVTGNSKLTTVCIWTVPRTLGTALSKCLSYVDGMQIFYEPFVSAYYFGPEGITPTVENIEFRDSVSQTQNVLYENTFEDNECTYDWVRQQLKADYPGKKILLVKDQAFCLDEKYDSLPPGVQHTFLIRHPYKVLSSWKSTLIKLMKKDNTVRFQDMPLFRRDDTDIFEMQLKLLRYVQENINPNPVIIDADDLQSNPASILRQFCQRVEIPYSDNLLEWPSDRDVINTWKISRTLLHGNLEADRGGFYETALTSTEFQPPTPTPKRSELPADLQEVTDISLTFYEQMYEMRLKP